MSRKDQNTQTRRKPLVSTDGLTTPYASPIETHVNCLNSQADFTIFHPIRYLVWHIRIKLEMSLFENRPAMGMVTRQILSYAP